MSADTLMDGFIFLKGVVFMAERRMFAKSIVLSDAFLDMPLSARCLYFTLGMLADDDGFIGSPKAIMRQCGASQDDMAILLQKRYILAFQSGVIVVKHWRMNNYLQNDRKKTTTYLEELETLDLDDKGAYIEKKTAEKNNVYVTYTQDSIGKDSIGKDSIINTSCAERFNKKDEPTAETEEDVFICLPLNDGTVYSVPTKDVEEWTKLYPAVDVDQELRNMRGWLMANKQKRKTRRGINTFINGWLSREQDKPKNNYGRRNDYFDENAFWSERSAK